MKKNIVEVLKQDHRSLDSLFEKIEATDEPDAKAALFEVINEEFEAHAKGEEKVVYPEMKRIPELNEKTEHSVEEHDEARELIKTIESLSPEDEKWESSVRKLQSEIEHHVEEEEEEMFPILEEKLTPEKLRSLAEDFEATKQNFSKAS